MMPLKTGGKGPLNSARHQCALATNHKLKGALLHNWKRIPGSQFSGLHVLADPVDFEDSHAGDEAFRKEVRMRLSQQMQQGASTLPPPELLQHSSLKVKGLVHDMESSSGDLSSTLLSARSLGLESRSSRKSAILSEAEHGYLNRDQEEERPSHVPSNHEPKDILRLSAFEGISESSLHHLPPQSSSPIVNPYHGGQVSGVISSMRPLSLNDSNSNLDEQSVRLHEETVLGVPKPIFIISMVSASLTMASCVFNTLLPIYMVVELKMTMRSMGMFEGILEAFSYIVRMFSGIISDMMTSRKSAITVGFAMGAMAKFGMSGATEVGSLFASKAVDRLANGVQAAPRDALISDLAPEDIRSSCFGFAQSMRKWGSAVGALAVFLLMKASGNNYQMIFTMAASLSMASCVAFVMLVPSHSRPQSQKLTGETSISGSQSSVEESKSLKTSVLSHVSKIWKDMTGMGQDFYRMLLVVSMYGMGHISEAMLESRAMEVGFGKAESTLVVAALAFVVFIVSYPMGKVDDKYGPRVTFVVGMAALILGNLTLMWSGSHPWTVFGSLIFKGIHMGVFQGPLLSIVVGLAPSNLRGTAFGIFYTVMALTAVGANTLFGSLWHSYGANAAFTASAAMTSVTLLSLPWLLPEKLRGIKQQPVAAIA